MIVVNVEQTTGPTRFYVTLRKATHSMKPETFGRRLFISALKYGSPEQARKSAEEVFGLLDWGKGGQPENQACVVVEP